MTFSNYKYAFCCTLWYFFFRPALCSMRYEFHFKYRGIFVNSFRNVYRSKNCHRNEVSEPFSFSIRTLSTNDRVIYDGFFFFGLLCCTINNYRGIFGLF